MNLRSVHFCDVTNSQQVTVCEVRKRICLSIMHKNPGLTVTGGGQYTPPLVVCERE